MEQIPLEAIKPVIVQNQAQCSFLFTQKLLKTCNIKKYVTPNFYLKSSQPRDRQGFSKRRDEDGYPLMDRT
jgi:hypothetical protein